MATIPICNSPAGPLAACTSKMMKKTLCSALKTDPTYTVPPASQKSLWPDTDKGAQRKGVLTSPLPKKISSQMYRAHMYAAVEGVAEGKCWRHTTCRAGGIGGGGVQGRGPPGALLSTSPLGVKIKVRPSGPTMGSGMMFCERRYARLGVGPSGKKKSAASGYCMVDMAVSGLRLQAFMAMKAPTRPTGTASKAKRAKYALLLPSSSLTTRTCE